MPTVPTTRYAILKLLEEEGAMHVAAIAEMLGRKHNTINSAIRLAHKHKLVHISGWKRSIGTSGRWGPIWKAGKGNDKSPPKVDSHLEASRRYAEKYRELIRRKTRARRGREQNIWLSILGTKS